MASWRASARLAALVLAVTLCGPGQAEVARFKIPNGMAHAQGGEGMCPVAQLVADKGAISLGEGSEGSEAHLIQAASSPPDGAQGPHYVFVTGLPGTGTTALAGLLYTSPEASSLCAGGSLFCEGRPLFKSSNEGPEVTHRSGFRVYDEPKDVFDAIETWSKLWDVQKPVLVEKSPFAGDFRGRAGRGRNMLYEDMHANLTKEGALVSFIFSVRSPCFRDGLTILTDNHTNPGNEARQSRRAGEPQPRFWGYEAMRDMFQVIERLRAAGARVLEVKFEEMVTDPFGTSRLLLDFLPELRSLDSSRSGYEGAACFQKKLNENQAHKAIPLAVYAATKLGKMTTGTFSGRADTTMIGQKLAEHGYTEEWFRGPHVQALERSDL